MGEVLLGMPGPWAKDYHEAADHYTTKVGGIPDWPTPDVEIRPNFLKCSVCGSRLTLVMQIYAPVCSDSIKNEERVLYVFGCTTQMCGSNPLSWRVLRVQKINTEEDTLPNDETTTSGTSASSDTKNECLEDIHTASSTGDDLENDDFDLEELGRALSEAATLVSHSKKPHRRRQTVKKAPAVKSISESTDAKNPVLPCFYLYSQKESFASHVSNVLSNYSSLSIKEKGDLDDPKEEENWEEEKYEYDSALFVDRTFLKFKKHLDAYPEQCFRYSYSGKPILASKDLETPANCELCGGFRQFELQLMPPLLYFLNEASDGSSTLSSQHWNWITLIVYTCSKNCSSTTHQGSSNKSWSVTEESVIIQYE
ncbi:hypothetical protein ACHQM5_017779 [Ranunculus cassubicifolius]